MSEKLCLQWNDFKANTNSAFGRLRDDKEFTDVTLACEDGQQMEAHKVILAASSPFFETILQRNKHPHPLIYLKGFQSRDLLSILDFLYFGEANVYQENLDSFLAIAEELKLKGLTGQTSSDKMKQETPSTENAKPKEASRKSTIDISYVQSGVDVKESPTAVAITNQFSGDLAGLDQKVKSMMERSQNMIQAGTRGDGTPKRQTAFICKVCGKEGLPRHIRDHIEANHLEGISILCEHCGKTFSARVNLSMHKSRVHK